MAKENGGSGEYGEGEKLAAKIRKLKQSKTVWRKVRLKEKKRIVCESDGGKDLNVDMVWQDKKKKM